MCISHPSANTNTHSRCKRAVWILQIKLGGEGMFEKYWKMTWKLLEVLNENHYWLKNFKVNSNFLECNINISEESKKSIHTSLSTIYCRVLLENQLSESRKKQSFKQLNQISLELVLLGNKRWAQSSCLYTSISYNEFN